MIALYKPVFPALSGVRMPFNNYILVVSLFLSLSIFVCVCTGTDATEHVWRSENTLRCQTLVAAFLFSCSLLLHVVGKTAHEGKTT